MKLYPISVNRMLYHGSNPAKLRKAAEYNKYADTLERHINEAVEKDPTPMQQFMYSKLARELKLNADLVRRVLFSVDCGHHGLTVIRSEAEWSSQADSRFRRGTV